jgi:hypothetical protein
MCEYAAQIVSAQSIVARVYVSNAIVVMLHFPLTADP